MAHNLFITVAKTLLLNKKHTIFGEVKDQDSRNVVDAIAQVETNDDKPIIDIKINSITIIEQ